MKNYHSLICLIGIPGAGKSTWVKDHLKTNNAAVISSDDQIEEIAQSKGKTYSEIFKTLNNNQRKQLDKELTTKFLDAVKNNLEIIIDRTSMTRRSRDRWLSQIPKNYRKVAIVFSVSDEELKHRLDTRNEETGKYIPQHVIDNFKKIYEEPSFTEFDEIKHIQS